MTQGVFHELESNEKGNTTVYFTSGNSHNASIYIKGNKKMKLFKIGMNKNKKRIWIEGKNLSQFGIKPSDRFDRVSNTNSIQIIFNSLGRSKVSGKGDKPIIDLSGNFISEIFPNKSHYHFNYFKSGTKENRSNNNFMIIKAC